ncbi:MAG: hypothetical protein E7562_03620 [Ruminococcaceae bacterium]|nr:hypothetical protein [Oscillospiraceae bacterium]
MKKYLISPYKKQYKANMHSHSTFSDGKLTPEELKKAYKERGYSVFAFSDHLTVTAHNELADEDFLPLTSAELDVAQQGDECFNLRKSFHFNIISRDPEHFEHVKCNPRNYSLEYINSLIADAKAKNYFVTANHPNWALFTEDEFLQIEGLNGFELYNCITANFGGALSFTPEIYLYLLRNGKRIYPIGADDNHSFCMPFSHPQNDSFGGFTYILADNLDYNTIISSLDRGDMYCSMGPQFLEVSIENNKIFIKTSDVKQISIIGENNNTKAKNALKEHNVNEYSTNLEDFGKFFVLHITDKNGNHAMTRAFYKGEDY